MTSHNEFCQAFVASFPPAGVSQRAPGFPEPLKPQNESFSYSLEP